MPHVVLPRRCGNRGLNDGRLWNLDRPSQPTAIVAYLAFSMTRRCAITLKECLLRLFCCDPTEPGDSALDVRHLAYARSSGARPEGLTLHKGRSSAGGLARAGAHVGIFLASLACGTELA